MLLNFQMYKDCVFRGGTTKSNDLTSKDQLNSSSVRLCYFAVQLWESAQWYDDPGGSFALFPQSHDLSADCQQDGAGQRLQHALSLPVPPALDLDHQAGQGGHQHAGGGQDSVHTHQVRSHHRAHHFLIAWHSFNSLILLLHSKLKTSWKGTLLHLIKILDSHQKLLYKTKCNVFNVLDNAYFSNAFKNSLRIPC